MTTIILKITYLKFLSNLPGANELSPVHYAVCLSVTPGLYTQWLQADITAYTYLRV